MMDRLGWQVFGATTNRWHKVVSGLQRIGRGAAVHPHQATDVFSLDVESTADPIRLKIAPVVLNLPERANHQAPNLYIVLQGWLAFTRPTDPQAPLCTTDFGTQVAYFRHKAGRLDHVYGAHYDLDLNASGHPICHGQVASKLDFGQHVLRRFDLPSPTDWVGHVLSTVRIPTPQMDFFAVLRQICADHLVGGTPPQPVLRSFRTISAHCDVGDPIRSHLQAGHWYT